MINLFMTQTRNMKILILNGSPRSNGLISRILDTMANEARQHKGEVKGEKGGR